MSLWILVRFVNHRAMTETPGINFFLLHLAGQDLSDLSERGVSLNSMTVESYSYGLLIHTQALVLVSLWKQGPRIHRSWY